jgi:hypothetical protein
MRYQWATVKFEKDFFDVCIDTRFDELDEIRAVDSEINLIEIMDTKIAKWFESEAMKEILDNRAAEAAEINEQVKRIPLGFTLNLEHA